MRFEDADEDVLVDHLELAEGEETLHLDMLSDDEDFIEAVEVLEVIEAFINIEH